MAGTFAFAAAGSGPPGATGGASPAAAAALAATAAAFAAATAAALAFAIKTCLDGVASGSRLNHLGVRPDPDSSLGVPGGS